MEAKSVYLINELAGEGNAQGTQEKTSVLIGPSSCVQSDMTPGDHSRGVPARVEVSS